MSKKVIIFGGGVAGLSAAHELIKRNFDVTIYESKGVPGGKARSTDVPESATAGRKPLPGEHGFRFFPRFYRHVTSTMKEIPFHGKTVYDNLTQTSEIRVAQFDKPSFFLPARFPSSIKDVKKYFSLDANTHLDLTEEEKEYFAERVWQLMTSCSERRKHEYERMGWWEFVEADRFSENYKTFLARGLTRTLVAAKAENVSTKTGGDILLQLMFDIMKPGRSCDCILNGPTNDVWINPWIDYLKSKGLKYHLSSPVQRINTQDRTSIKSITVKKNNEEIDVSADYYIGAVPVEVMASLINDDMLAIDPTLENIKTLSANVAWMNGLQLYMTEDVVINNGHTIYINTPWSLTSISQAQFWKDFDWTKYGDGTVKGIISIDISDWDNKGILYNKPAKECTTTEIVHECWAQLKKSLNINGSILLKDEHLHAWNLDNSIVPGVPTINLEPLLVNNKNTWTLRPYPYTDISNFFLASDYVKTNTDLATMEGANEAARRAVNAILDVSKTGDPYCKIWNLHEPLILRFFRFRDSKRYAKGRSWDGKLPFGVARLTKLLKSIISLIS